MKVKIGSVVGNLLVISERYKRNNVYYNMCKCECGNIKEFHNWHLNNSKVKACGCLFSGLSRFKYEGIEDLSKAYYTSFKYSRKSKGIEFSDDITMDFLWKLFLKQNKKCALSGMDISLSRQWSKENNGLAEKTQTASIDRIDSSKGYTLDNIQWVHKKINYMKGSLKDDEFIEICRIVSNNNLN